jgi:hypothetical protein
MIKILNIEYKGYAPATTGGVSYIVNMEAPSERFPDIAKGRARLSVVVPLRKSEKIKYHIISRLIDDNGKISHWGEDEELNLEEKQLIDAWIIENKLIEDARAIDEEHERQYKIFNDVLKKKKKIYAERPADYDGIIDKMNRLDELDKEFDAAKDAMDALTNVKVV